MNIIEKPRESNFELLRIIAMLMIICFHIVCVFDSQLKSPSSYEIIDGSLFHEPIFYKRLLIAEFITPFGKTGDTIFILICGYFTFPGGGY